ncbi:hypothetical protein [Breznakia pachnodae]|uniref:Transposase n=1 Tax=Breznakia pachnodae TaxID=265178 RepID=A0ABU0E406_9FIRM|nr:hypothetical protein [Breznakia pachnodae]MDQ0361636.1 transposase [Breznakia pachnodae]
MYEILYETKKNLAERSQYYLLKRGMSILQLSKKLNKAYSVTYSLVNNKNKMFIEERSIEMLAKEFGVSNEVMISALSDKERSEFEELQKKKKKRK